MCLAFSWLFTRLFDEGGSFDKFGFFDRKLECLKLLGDFFLIVSVFGCEMQADTIVDVSAIDSVEFL